MSNKDIKVEECIHYNEVDEDREYCQLTYNIFKKKCQKKCKDITDCYFKQLKNKENEYSELMESYTACYSHNIQLDRQVKALKRNK